MFPLHPSEPWQFAIVQIDNLCAGKSPVMADVEVQPLSKSRIEIGEENDLLAVARVD